MESSSPKVKNFDSVLLSLISLSEKNFRVQYGIYDKKNAEKLYSTITEKIFESFSSSNTDYLAKLFKVIKYIKNIEDQSTLENFNNAIDKSIKDSNFVILACKFNQVCVLEYVFKNTDILGLLKNDQKLVTPDDIDDERHNAFYYAIRSGNCKLIETLIKKWPKEYFQVSPQNICNLLASSYEELKLKNIILPYDMIIHIESLLIDYRFYSDSSENKNATVKTTHQNIKERSNLVITNIDLLIHDYSSSNLDERFFYLARLIAQNIHILKRSLRSTYNNLPWEEIEFCLIAFISNERKYETQTKVICNFFLTKKKLLNYLKIFSILLEKEMNNICKVGIKQLAILPSCDRDKVISFIIQNNADLKELYEDYQNLRDAHSLEVISEYLQLALSINPNDQKGQLIVIRTLQVIGEYLKNTLESPKISTAIGNVLLSSLPTNTRKLIIKLRDSLSHGYSDSLKIQMSDNIDSQLFSKIQQDIKVINTAIINILYKMRFKHFIKLSQNILHCETIDDINNVLETFNDFDLKTWFNSNGSDERQQMIESVDKMKYFLVKNNIDDSLLSDVKFLIKLEFVSEKDKIDFFGKITLLTDIRNRLRSKIIDSNDIRDFKYEAERLLSAVPNLVENKNCERIRTKLLVLLSHIELKLSADDFSQACGLATDILYKIGSDDQGLKWIEEVGNKLSEKNDNQESIIEKASVEYSYQDQVRKLKEEYALKISTLKSILNDNHFDGFLSYKNDKKLQATVEMLILDLISIINDSGTNILCDDNFFLDKYSPILIGKNLRNHLAHGNDIVEILQFDPSVAVFLNAKKFTTENIIESNKKIGKALISNLDDLKTKYEDELKTLSHQEEIFKALEQGNLQKLKDILQTGADINGRDFQSWSALHFAAKGPSVEVVKFVLGKIINPNVTNNFGQNALHIAAEYGRKSTVELLLQNNFEINSLDKLNQSSLHKAAKNCHEAIVKVLLEYNADSSIQDDIGYSPIHYAVLNNHKNIVDILLSREHSVDSNKAYGGYSILYLASETGKVNLVEYFIKKKADINLKTGLKSTPLLIAAKNGHLEVVKILLSHNADVNSTSIPGFTALHYAVEANHEQVVEFLLCNGVNVNYCTSINNFAPIHSAAEKGYLSMLKLLLKYKADVNIATSDGQTPLHYAALYGHTDVVEFLLQQKLSINVQDKGGLSPLHCAILNSHDSIVKLLLEKNASIHIQGSEKLLHVTAKHGNKKCVELLLKHGADINCKDKERKTPLHWSSKEGNVETTQVLIEKGANINSIDHLKWTPLHAASHAGEIKIVEILIEAGAKIDLPDSKGRTPIQYAIHEGHANIVDYLIRNKADIHSKILGSTVLHVALQLNHQDVAKVIIKNNFPINTTNQEGQTALEGAVYYNQVDIVKLLLKQGATVNSRDNRLMCLAIEKGHKIVVCLLYDHGCKNINQVMSNGFTLLHLAVKHNNISITEFLLSKGANVNATGPSGLTPLLIATELGFTDMVKLLLKNKASSSIKNTSGFSVLRSAIERNHFEITELLFEHEKINPNLKLIHKLSMLECAARGGSVQITEYLVAKGANIHSRNENGAKPIHVAAGEGHRHIVEFYLNKNVDMYDRGVRDWTIMHYAVQGQHIEVVKYLIDKKFNINVFDKLGQTPLHIAAVDGPIEIIEILLNNGNAYNLPDYLNNEPSEIADIPKIKNLFNCIEKLFEAVAKNDITIVKQCIKENVVINAKNSKEVTALHYAARNGNVAILEILLNNKANPNVIKNGATPLHYGAKFGHLQVVEMLLNFGAIYNAGTKKKSTPLDVSVDPKISTLLKFIDESFKKIKNHDIKIIDELKKANKKGINLNAVMNAQNIDGETLIVYAIRQNFPDVSGLKKIDHEDLDALLFTADHFKMIEKYTEALTIYNEILEKKKKIFRSDDPSVLDIYYQMGYVYYKQQKYQLASDTFTNVYNTQKKVLGENNENTLKTKCLLAMTKYRLGDPVESLKLFEETFIKQKEILDSTNEDLLHTQIQMSQVLFGFQRYEEALTYYSDALKKLQIIHGENHPNVYSTKNNIAKVYSLQGQYDKALTLYQEVYKSRKRVFGPNHSDTLRAIFNKIEILMFKKKYSEALTGFNRLLVSQNTALGPKHLDTLNTKLKIGDIYNEQGKHFDALEIYSDIYYPMAAVYGVKHGLVQEIMVKISNIKLMYHVKGEGGFFDFTPNKIELSEIAKKIESIKVLLETSQDVNRKDENGLTLLHHAVNNQDQDIVEFLLKNNIDCSSTTKKGNTVLHFSVMRNNKNIMCILLKYAQQTMKTPELQNFIDAKTTSGGMTCMHVAAQKGFRDMVQILLEYGAVYNKKNFKDNKTPHDICNDNDIKILLKTINDLFVDVKKGVDILGKLHKCDKKDHKAILSAKNTNNKTLINIVLDNKQTNLSCELLKMV